jgi:hypothetical protein
LAEKRPSFPSKRAPEKLDAGTNKADNTQVGYKTAEKYIERYLHENELPTFKELTKKDVEADHLQNFVENIMYWLTVTQFKTQSGYLQNQVKLKYFSNIKMVWMGKFSQRTGYWNNDDYWKKLNKEFAENCKRSRINDPSVEETRKSAPLYRDVSSVRSTVVRAKHMENKVDAKTIAMVMIEASTPESIQKLAEFNLCRNAIGRGAEHVFSRWTEASWDDYYNAPDFDWVIVKQKDTKCALLFNDRHLYCLCSLFALGAFMLFGGLRRDREKYSGAIENYVFPGLHEMKKVSVASGLTASIKKFVKANFSKQHAKQYSSRSFRKGAMTDNRANQNLSTQEEYALSGHDAPDTNQNAEGYIETTAAMSAPAGKVLAGYSDPHASAFPMRLTVSMTKTDLWSSS